MYEKDYIMRMIQQMIKVLLELFGLRQKGSYEESFELINLTLQENTGLSSEMINSFDEESLIAYLSPSGNLNFEKCFVVGILLKEEGEILFKQNSIEEGFTRFRKSYALLDRVRNTSYAEMLPQMNSIFADLENKLGLNGKEL
jgi:hypothetical protein